MQALSSHYEIYKRVCFYTRLWSTRLWSQSSFLLSAPGAETMTFSGVVSRNTSPTASLPSAVTSLNATGTTLGAPLAQVASVCPVCQEALSDEESAEAPPAAEEARRFRGSVLTAGRGSGWEPADTTVSAEEHAKKSPPKWVVISGAGDEESAEAPPAADEARRFRGSIPTASRGRGWELVDTTVSAGEKAKKITTRIGGDFCDCPQVLLSALPPTARKGECEGGTFDGFPHSRSITRPQATTFAQQKCCSKKKTPS